MENIQNQISDIRNHLTQLKQKPKLQEEKSFFTFYNELKQQDIDEIINSKSDNIKVTFRYNNYENIFSNIELLGNLKNNINFKIDIDNKNEFNDYIFNNLNKIDNPNIIINNINANAEEIKISEYIKYERILIDIAKTALDLTPFEKYLFAYNIVKNYKEYKKSDSWNESRTLYDSLNGEYIVCAGYTRLLEDLLEKLNVESKQFSVLVFDEETQQNMPHSIIQVNINDEKYGINGIYYGDPTNDADFKNGKDYYTFCLMTTDEMSLYKTRDMSIQNLESVFMCNTSENFFQLIEEWKKSNENKSVSYLAHILSKDIKKIDNGFYRYLIDNFKLALNFNNYSNSDDLSRLADDKVAMQIIFDISNYIVERNNKHVNSDVFYSGVKRIYQQFYGFKNEQDLQNTLNKVIDYNESANKSLNEDYSANIVKK